MVTRDEVAHEAGTSTAVVSYVINNGPRNVAEPTRQRVLAAVAKLGYRPNAVARALRSSTTRAIGLIVPDITNPFFAELAQAVETAAFASGNTLLLGNAMRRDDLQTRYLAAFLEHQVRGVVFIGGAEMSTAGAAESLSSLAGGAVPLVFLDRRQVDVDGATIVVDNRAGGRLATRHLLEHGHRTVLAFAGPRGLSSVAERAAGWADALIESGLDPAQQPTCETDFDRYASFEAATRLFASGSSPSAIFVHSDEQSLGIVHAAATAGLRIPDDVALVSFDGIRESAICTPGLTTVQQPLAEIAAQAVALVTASGAAISVRPDQVLPVQLVIRRSCGCG